MTPGASDAAYLRNAGIPVYGIGLLEDIGEQRAHGRDERIAVASFQSAEHWIYDLVKQLAAAQ
jgi:acetylornithine deacetylase/succinyl-diaminopimelate desuccinylase-like protein